METFKLIICPIDFSESSEKAIGMAAKLMNDGGTIMLVHAVQIPHFYDPYSLGFYDVNTKEILKASKATLKKKQKELEKTYTHIKFDSVTEVVQDPAELINEIGKKRKADLIVIGSHGRKGLNRILMGSVAESVMRDAKIPVIVVKI